MGLGAETGLGTHGKWDRVCVESCVCVCRHDVFEGGVHGVCMHMYLEEHLSGCGMAWYVCMYMYVCTDTWYVCMYMFVCAVEACDVCMHIVCNMGGMYMYVQAVWHVGVHA